MNKPTIQTLNEPSNEFVDFCSQSNRIKIVPEFYNGSNEKSLHRDSGSFAKWIHNNNPEIYIEYNPDIKKISLHNNEIWLPLVFLSSDISAQIYIGLVINFMYDKLKSSLSGEKNKAKVNFSFECTVGDTHKAFNYSGDVEGLEIFNKIDVNKFFK